jgi:hypothetical protein
MADLSEFLSPSATVDDDDNFGADSLRTLRVAWVNEKCAPELLRYEEAAVNRLNTLIHQQVSSLLLSSQCCGAAMALLKRIPPYIC